MIYQVEELVSEEDQIMMKDGWQIFEWDPGITVLDERKWKYIKHQIKTMNKHWTNTLKQKTITRKIKKIEIRQQCWNDRQWVHDWRTWVGFT